MGGPFSLGRGMQAQEAATPKLTAPRCSVVHAWLKNDVLARLQAAADRRRIHPDQLVASLVETVLDHPNPDAVIDALLVR